MFYVKKSEKVEAFRVGYQMIPDWLEKRCTKINTDIIIEVTADREKAKIIIKGKDFIAESGDWIVKEADGQLVRYEHKHFFEIFESSEE